MADGGTSDEAAERYVVAPAALQGVPDGVAPMTLLMVLAVAASVALIVLWVIETVNAALKRTAEYEDTSRGTRD